MVHRLCYICTTREWNLKKLMVIYPFISRDTYKFVNAVVHWLFAVE